MNNLLSTLPEAVQNEVKDTLKAFHRVNVTFHDGSYHVETGCYLLAKYPDDFKSIGEFKDTDVYTKEEMMINYVESFHDYPIDYKGHRDYSIFRTATWETRFQFDENGNIVVSR